MSSPENDGAHTTNDPSDALNVHKFKVPFPVIRVHEDMETDTVAFAEALNYQNGCLAEIRDTVAGFAALLDGLMKSPMAGMILPPGVGPNVAPTVQRQGPRLPGMGRFPGMN